MSKLKNKFIEVSVPYIQSIKEIVQQNQDLVVDQVTLGQLYGGLRDVVALVTETSLLDNNKGISFWGHTIDDLRSKEPQEIKNWLNNKEPLIETVFWLLLTGTLPTLEDVKDLATDLHKRAQIDDYIFKLIETFPKTSHPMVIFTTVLSALENNSQFNTAYRKGVAKNTLWEHAFEDALNLIAKLPILVAYIYNYLYNDNKNNIKSNPNLDWAGNFAHLMGDKDNSTSSILKEFFRTYMFIHSDHEGGNASANTAHVAGSTLASPYGSFAAGMHSLSGPLHGMATQNALNWVANLLKKASSEGKKVDKQFTTDYIHNTLANKQVIPGYGHAVLRKTDPRFTEQMLFAKHNNLTSDLLEGVWAVYAVAPEILGSVGKIKNPFPNVDAHSGALLDYFGFKNTDFYTVFFGASRSLGIMAQQIWDRTFMAPLHRPKSVTSLWIKDFVEKNKVNK